MYSDGPCMAFGGGGECRGGWKGDWAHVGVGGCKTSRGKQKGEGSEAAPFSDNAASLCRTSPN